MPRLSALTLVVMVGVILGTFGSSASAHLHPEAGRFVERDPLGYADGLNLAEYVRSAPMCLRDPSGREIYDDINRLLNDAEKALLQQWGYAYFACCVGPAGRKALQEAQASGLDGAHNGPQDALRHCIWMCRLRACYNAERARQWGEAHETTSDSDEETQMDLLNNSVGIGLGDVGASRCPDRCKQAHDRGDLVHLRPGGGSGPVPPGTGLVPTP